jgi:hypothetical protein
MRADMYEVLIERPRRGLRLKHRRGNKPRVQDWDGEDGFETRNPLRQQRTRFFDDLLGPLRKYLQSQVGRPWDKVYAEVCAHIDSRSTVGQHLRDHVQHEVLQHCELDAAGRAYRVEDGVARAWVRWFVHPRTGLLCRQPSDLRWQQEQRARREAELAWIRVIETKADYFGGAPSRVYIKIKGIWFEADTERCAMFRHHSERVDFEFHRKEMRITQKRQLARPELRNLGLSNDSE